MNCEQVRELLLEVDPDELDLSAAPEAGEHVRGCASCSAALRRIARVNTTFTRAVAALQPRRSADALVAVAFGGDDAGVDANESLVLAHIRQRTSRRRRIGLLALAGSALLAASVVLGIMLSTPPDVAHVAAADAGAYEGASDVSVEVPEGQNAIVFRTRDPKTTVVWIYSGD